MVLVLKQLYKGYVHYVVNSTDPRADGYFLMGPPHQLLSCLIFYLYFVKKLGPRLMKERSAFELKTVLIVYNAIQVFSNLIIGYTFLITMLRHNFNFACHPVNYTGSEEAYLEAKLAYQFFALKLFDLLDTAFFVLRKKYNQISFLHVYHHIVICVGAYIMARYIPVGHAAPLSIVNLFVHSVMYFYYFLTCVRPEVKTSIWWKKHITHIQMIQFAYLIVHFARPLIFGNCSYPKTWLFVGLTQNLFMLVLFSDFYFKAYFKKSEKMA